MDNSSTRTKNKNKRRSDKNAAVSCKSPKKKDALNVLPKEPDDNIQKTDEISDIDRAIYEATGTVDPLAMSLITQVATMQSFLRPTEDDELLKIAVSGLAEMKASNATEAMLAIQMIGVHHAVIKFLHDATHPNQTLEGGDANVLRATRLMRLFNQQLEAMAKLKGKTGQQKVTVEHVHVNAGGQAIVGSIESGKRNRGEGDK